MGTPGRPRRRIAALAGLLAGAVVGAGTAALTGHAVANRAAVVPEPTIEATHLPPLLRLAGERVELRFDAHCVSGPESPEDAPCDASGSVFVRAGTAGPYRELTLSEETAAVEGRYAAVVPDAIARSPRGFSYYAVLRDRASDLTATVPAGGADAPQRSIPLDGPVDVSLGVHTFGRPRAAGDRVVEASWGEAANELGLEQGRNPMPVGASSFDVANDGTVHVLDEARRRVLRWRAGAREPEVVNVPIHGTIADLAVSDDGALHVLETTVEAGGSPMLRSFDRTGNSVRMVPVHARAAQVRLDPGGLPIVREQSSSQWQPTAAHDGRALSLVEQRAAGRAGRPTRDGSEVVVLRRANEVLLALSGGGAMRSWRVTSETPLGEVQLAEALGRNLVVVMRVYTDARDEFVVLLLGSRGIVSRFSVDSADWAETAPLSRFRLVGSSLFQLGSTPSRVFVDRFDLEVE